ncbi:class I SAM-dependent methyltransferase [Oxynema aestuarii]|jgi:SAM-dependent methyltransferase|uniref:Class I SAM-dependent methyltransferase n=1 Tax=Oxynema aestuarii AP17 TaxID=2064643 RepID=A0A6H1U416_9CYAN|nr:class I SAM-dependent methyltransferase [Oxynema aestuarii]QIZ72773.1 class I SAM-dependent methyltransferase [Oxynema aestuarii AP17]RMH75725.1 MAG: class I SAM-dependent methyltransferase [Cyanobacteria bacterium J007]
MSVPSAFPSPHRDRAGASPWETAIAPVALRYNREYRGEPFDLPEEVEAMPIFHERASGQLQAKITSPFWELVKPKKNQHCLDLGCGVGFLIYPWRDWGAYFYGREISSVARDALNARGPQLNSKLFKGVQLGSADRLDYGEESFDLAIATGFSCYYPLDYWVEVLSEVRRVLKPGAHFVFDVVDPASPLAENWAILETYLGAEVFLEPIAAWEQLIKSSGGKILKRQPGELFNLYKIKFPS